MELESSAMPGNTVNALHLVEFTSTLGSLCADLASRKVTSDHIVKIARLSSGRIEVAALTGRWSEGQTFRQRLRISGSHLRSVVRIGSNLTAIGVMAADVGTLHTEVVPIVQCLTILEDRRGNKPEEVHFVGAPIALPIQLVQDAAKGETHILWQPGAWGVSDVSVDRYRNLLFGVLTDPDGRGRRIASFDYRTALCDSSLLMDVQRWTPITRDDSNAYIISLSRAECSPSSTKFYVHRNGWRRHERTIERLFFVPNDSSGLEPMRSTSARCDTVAVGPLRRTRAIVGMREIGLIEDEGGFGIELTVEPNQESDSPFRTAN